MTRHEAYRREGLKLSANPLIIREASVSAALENHTQSVVGLRTREIEGQEDFLRVEGVNYNGLPEFQRHAETTNIELFYDLFFVANLTIFSYIHEINNSQSLSAYIGFFCVLWFTWCQVSLFDVRFVVDSVLERAAKAVHLGVMVGLAVVGPNFDPAHQKKQVFQTMSLILMISRIVLSLQYLQIMWHVRRYENAKLPFILIAGVNLTAAAIYLGVTFSFSEQGSMGYISFYVIAVFEIATNIVISSIWKVVTFKGTHLVQRMSLLTLIILGEGVMTIVQKLVPIVLVGEENAWDSPTIGTIVAGTSIIYILYMLYFDALPDYHFGSIRQQFWAFLHFPLHLFLVLFLEGMAQFIIWFKMNEAANTLSSLIFSPEVSDLVASNNGPALVAAVNSTISQILTIYPPPDGQKSEIFQTVNETLTAIQSGSDNTNGTALNSLIDLALAVLHSIYQTYGFEAPELDTGTAPQTGIDELINDINVILLVFVYFFVSAGVTLILMGVLNILTLPRYGFSKAGWKHPDVWGRIAVFFVVGSTLAGLAGLVNLDAGLNLSASPWLLPVITLALVIVLGMQYMRWPKRKQTSEEKD